MSQTYTKDLKRRVYKAYLDESKKNITKYNNDVIIKMEALKKPFCQVSWYNKFLSP